MNVWPPCIIAVAASKALQHLLCAAQDPTWPTSKSAAAGILGINGNAEIPKFFQQPNFKPPIYEMVYQSHYNCDETAVVLK